MNRAGLKAKYDPTLIANEADSTIQNEVYPLVDSGDYAGAIARLDHLIGTVKPQREQLQLLLAFKGQLYFSSGDKQKAVGALDDAIALDPQSEPAARARAARQQIVGG
jgi:Tfp pilus assembly protein PilF